MSEIYDKCENEINSPQKKKNKDIDLEDDLH